MVGNLVALSDGAVVACRVLDDVELVPPATARAVLPRRGPRVVGHSERQVGDLRTTFSLAGT